MGVYEGRGQLTKAMRLLMLQWEETKVSWDDAVAGDWEQKHLLPLQESLRRTVGAMDHMALVLQQIRRECE